MSGFHRERVDFDMSGGDSGWEALIHGTGASRVASTPYPSGGARLAPEEEEECDITDAADQTFERHRLINIGTNGTASSEKEQAGLARTSTAETQESKKRVTFDLLASTTCDSPADNSNSAPPEGKQSQHVTNGERNGHRANGAESRLPPWNPRFKVTGRKSSLGDRPNGVYDVNPLDRHDKHYLTPLQRKEQEVKELRLKVEETKCMIEDRKLKLKQLAEQREREIAEVNESRKNSIEELKTKLNKLHQERDKLHAIEEQERARMQALEQSLQSIKLKNEERKKMNQELFLEMYKKGRESAFFEREVQLELNSATKDAGQTDEETVEKVKALLTQLDRAQRALEYWQNQKPPQRRTPVMAARVKRRHSCDGDVEEQLLDDEVDAFLSFMKDSLFHYLVEPRRELAEEHLHVLINSFYFTDEQRKELQKSIQQRKRKGTL